ncbi:hypothetical protein [Halorussus amylolyticus]|uniref:hypothetical protein n=1 Tax=Halorussus amylolyticus TaxID=1126242 RepID=UPI001051FED1|nr:hypothetical protein [Halorussus amylolyticus]
MTLGDDERHEISGILITVVSPTGYAVNTALVNVVFGVGSDVSVIDGCLCGMVSLFKLACNCELVLILLVRRRVDS